MATTISHLIAKLDVDRKALKKGLSGATMDFKGFVSKALTIAAPLAAAFTVKAVVDATNVQIKAERKLAQVLKTTGGAAGFSAEQIKSYAGELQALTGIGDELTINSAALLGTFKQVQGNVFRDALATIQDMSATMDGDMKGATIQVGKALNDPIKGMAALAEVGVSFTEEQRQQIRNFQESGRLVEAQRVILAELKGEFGGVAEATRDPLTHLQGTVGDIAEKFGRVILPSLHGIADETIKFLTDAVGTDAAFDSLGSTLADDVVPAFREMLQSLKDMKAIADVLVIDPLKFWTPDNTPEVIAGTRRGVNNPFGFDTGAGMGPSVAPPVPKAVASPSARAFGGMLGEQFNKAPGLLDDLAGAYTDFTKRMQESYDREVKDQERLIEARKEAQDLFDRTRTPDELFKMEQERLTKLFAGGHIGEDLLFRGLDQAMPELERAPEVRNQALERGSEEAFDVVLRALTPKGPDAEQTRHEEVKNLLREIKEAVQRTKPKEATFT